MANPWFRLYSEFADDPKVQIMSEALQRRLVMLFCSRCKEETLHETERAFHWRISETELASTKAIFIEKGFIDEEWNLLNWNRRQFLSDSSTERVRRYRQGKKQYETLHETVKPVTVTAPDTEQIQTQSRTEQNPHPKNGGINPEMLARGLAENLGLSLGYGPTSFNTAVTEVGRAELKAGRCLEDVAVDMEAAYRFYDQEKPKLRITWGPAKFFGEGHWRNPDAWPRKEERKQIEREKKQAEWDAYVAKGDEDETE